MNHQTQEAFASWLDGQIAGCAARRANLQADQRKDEANFEKIRENIYDIFRTVLCAAQRTHGENTEAVNLFFLNRLDEIPANWQTAWDKASANGDETRMHLEQLKLETVREIKARYLQEVTK